MRKINIMSLLSFDQDDQESLCNENFVDLYWYTGRYPVSCPG